MVLTRYPRVCAFQECTILDRAESSLHPFRTSPGSARRVAPIRSVGHRFVRCETSPSYGRSAAGDAGKLHGIASVGCATFGLRFRGSLRRLVTVAQEFEPWKRSSLDITRISDTLLYRLTGRGRWRMVTKR